MRDAKMSSVYDAEMFMWRVAKRRFKSISEVEQYVKALFARKRFAELFPSAVAAGLPDLAEARLSGSTVGVQRAGTIRLAPEGFTEHTVLHEVAHYIVFVTRWKGDDQGMSLLGWTKKDRFAGHGGHYTQVMLLLVRMVCGVKAAQELRKSYHRNRVPVRPKQKVAMSEEMRQMLRERMERINAAKPKVICEACGRAATCWERIEHDVSCHHFDGCEECGRNANYRTGHISHTGECWRRSRR